MHTNAPLMLVLACLLMAGLFASVPRMASADDYDYALASGWEWDRAPVKTSFTLWTGFNGTRDELEDVDLDDWTSEIWMNIEFALLGENAEQNISLIAEWGFRVYTDFEDLQGNSLTGANDLLLGAKGQIMQSQYWTMSVFLTGTLPIGEDGVGTQNDWVWGEAGFAALGFLTKNVGGNFRVYTRQLFAGEDNALFNLRLLVEGFLLVPELDMIGRLGIEADYVDGQGFDDDSYYVYIEGYWYGMFMRLATPIDINTVRDNSYHTIWETGQFNILIGFSYTG